MFQERLRTLSEHIQTIRSIISINKGVSQEEVEVTEEMELGLQFDVGARKNLLIYSERSF